MCNLLIELPSYVRPNTSPSDPHLRGSCSVTPLCSLIVIILKNYLKIIDFVLTTMQKEEYKQMKNVTASCIQRRKPLKWKKIQPKAKVPPRGNLALGSTHLFNIASSTSTTWFPRSLTYMANQMVFKVNHLVQGQPLTQVYPFYYYKSWRNSVH
jgi:hypothetical protein